jgi:hypothetical protein
MIMISYADLWIVHSHVANLLDCVRLEFRELKACARALFFLFFFSWCRGYFGRSVVLYSAPARDFSRLRKPAPEHRQDLSSVWFCTPLEPSFSPGRCSVRFRAFLLPPGAVRFGGLCFCCQLQLNSIFLGRGCVLVFLWIDPAAFSVSKIKFFGR